MDRAFGVLGGSDRPRWAEPTSLGRDAWTLPALQDFGDQLAAIEADERDQGGNGDAKA
jgi:hypothetical protein